MTRTRSTLPRHCRRRLRGATAIEFAIIFPVFFLIFYAIVTYALIMVAQQSLTLAASEGARAMLRYQTSLPARQTTACNVAQASLTWLPQTPLCPTPTLVTSQASCTVAGYACYSVVVTYNYAAAPLVPPLLGPLLSLPTPATLTGRAVVYLKTTAS
ncbi:TadE/TadG family type IV pilus assembly protein [Xylophilus sp. GW821-FHT01B05]